jgi:hypothetical protein
MDDMSSTFLPSPSTPLFLFKTAQHDTHFTMLLDDFGIYFTFKIFSCVLVGSLSSVGKMMIFIL